LFGFGDSITYPERALSKEHKEKNMYNAIFALALLVSLGGCVSVAKISDFPDTATSIDFDAARAKNNQDPAAWSQQANFEYVIELENTNEDDAIKAISEGFKQAGYKVAATDKAKQKITAEKGMTMLEWNSISVAYYKMLSPSVQVFVVTKITQDFTGGWKDHRAKNIADAICASSKKCKPV
jgi:hypothetical protein